MPSPSNPPGHLWRDKWTALSGPLSLTPHHEQVDGELNSTRLLLESSEEQVSVWGLGSNLAIKPE